MERSMADEFNIAEKDWFKENEAAFCR